MSNFIIEIATFKLKEGLSPASFLPFDKAVEEKLVSKNHGFISRQSGATADGEWLVIVHWETVEDVDASMASFADSPAAAEFMANLQPETMSMKRYIAN